MEVKIKEGSGYVDAEWTIEDGVMVVSPKEVFEPKDGDVCKSINCIYIFKRVKPSGASKDESAIVYHCCYNGVYLTVGENVGVGYISRNQRYATEEEKKLLFDKLAEKGLAWSAERKELVELKWKPKDHEKVYVAGFTFYGDNPFCAFEDTAYSGSMQWRAVFERGWYFKTEQECQEFCDRLNEAIKQVKL